MSPSFDIQAFNEPVYKKILGLEGNRIVSDWYSLLGVAKFESDEAKIDEAMLRRFEQARRYQVGSYENQALRLIDELGRAYACLTNDDTRLSYDKTLGDQPDSDAFADAMEALLLNEVVETNTDVVEANVVPAEAHVAPVDLPKREAAKQPANNDTTCPQCGKPTSPKAPVCYQCGYKKQTNPKQVSKENKRGNDSTGDSFQALVRQDLTPEQLLTRLREMRKLTNAANLAEEIWKAPKPSIRKGGREEPSSHCRDCGKGLMRLSDAFGIRESELRRTRSFVESYARKLVSLGRANFEWPLTDEDIRQVQQQMAEPRGINISLYCRGCASRIFRSPQVVS